MIYEQHEEGIYHGTIRHWFLGRTQNDTPFIQFNVCVESEEHFDGTIHKVDPFTVPVPLYLSSGARERTVTMLKYLGFTDTDPRKLDRKHKEAHDFDGLAVKLRCELEEYNGKGREKWQFVRGPKEATEAEKESIFAGLSEPFETEMNRALGRIPETSDAESDLVASDIPF